jgi:hypothetical protein
MGTEFATSRDRRHIDMADKNMPDSSSNRDQAEGERWSSEQESVRNSERDNSSFERGSSSSGRSGSSSERSSEGRNSYSSENRDESAGGISNRPLGEEIENQESLPQRGKTQSEEQPRRNEDVER